MSNKNNMIKILQLDKKLPVACMLSALLMINVPSAWAQDSHSASAGSDVKVMDASAMDFSGMDMEDSEQPMEMDHGEGMSMDMGSMQGGSAPADARDPHAYAGGYTIDDSVDIPRLVLADEYNFGSLLFDRLETAPNSDETSIAYDLQAWYGRDYDRLVFKAEGEIEGGELEDSSIELLWGHAVTTFWDVQLGLRYDSGEDPGRGWLALGIQGLAPYWFEVDSTFYIGDEGRSALSFEAEYELLLTQKLVLQPSIEASFYGKSDSSRAQGAGLNDMTVGLRLRYEIQREFAPYIGVEWASKFGGSARFAQAAGLSRNDNAFVAGVRFWF